MNHRLIFRIVAIVGLAFGLALLLAPDALMNAYGVESMNTTGRHMAMLYGAALTGYGFMNWGASRAVDLAEIHYVLIGNLVGNALGLVVSLYRVLMVPAEPQSVWLNVAIFLAFTGMFAYLYRTSPAGYRLHAAARHA